MAGINKRRLVAAALKARERALAPYSLFKVGAALLTDSGKIVAGANVESVSYGLTCCAERVALFKALTDGERRFVAIAVVTGAPEGSAPCGACRQLLAEYAPAALVLMASATAPGRITEATVSGLLPGAFLKIEGVKDGD
jgi:cytidine deaminase